uniref:Putative secreted protein n=1 Tax=Panstrongylus lignarius TaxID=156445 RepID=A0A224Y337_9HEMI
MIKAAATFLTLGHLSNAMIVSRFPRSPTIINVMVEIAAKVNRGWEYCGKVAFSPVTGTEETPGSSSNVVSASSDMCSLSNL